MRCSHLAVGALALAFGISCDSKGSAQAEADGKAETKAAVGTQADGKADGLAGVDAKVDADVAAAVELKPQIGGTIVAAGEYYVEILAFVDGVIEAVVLDAKGQLVADAGGKFDLAATLAAKGDAKAKVDLKWDPPSARFVGKVEAGVELVPGPIEIALEVDGKASIGALASLGLAAHASHGGQIMVAGDYSLEIAAQGELVHVWVFDASGKAHAAGDLDLDLDAGTKLDLKWDPPSASYSAKLDGELDLEAKPIVVRVAADAKVFVAAVASFHASAKLAVKGELDASAEIKPPSVSAKADGQAHGKAGASGKGSAKTSGSAGGKAGAKGSAKGGVKGGVSGKAKAGFNIGG